MKLVVPTHIVLFHQYQSIMALLAYMEQYSVKKFLMYSVLSTLRIKYVEHFQTNSPRMDKFNFGYSTNNILIATERQYKLKLVEKIKAIIKRMRWKAFYFEQRDTSDKTLPPMKIKELFEKDLFKIVEKNKVSKINSTQI